MRLVLFFIFMLTTFTAEARVFNFQNNWIAAYFRGTGGLSEVGDDAFGSSSGAATLFEDKVAYNFSAEIGFLILMSDKATLRIGIEALQTKNIKAEGKDALGDKLLDVESRIITYSPNATFEYSFRTTDKSKIFAFAGVGYSTVKLTNDYTLTAAGNTEYPLATDGKVSGDTMVLSSHYGLGYEMFLLDNVTFVFEAGYRYFPVGKLEARADASPPSGAITKGDTITDNIGKSLDIDMGGPYAGVAFRFYIPPLN